MNLLCRKATIRQRVARRGGPTPARSCRSPQAAAVQPPGSEDGCEVAPRQAPLPPAAFRQSSFICFESDVFHGESVLSNFHATALMDKADYEGR